MAWLSMRRRYWCRNVTDCELARGDKEYSYREYIHSQHKCSNCGFDLIEGDPLPWSRLLILWTKRWVIPIAVTATVAGGLYYVYRLANPLPLTGVSFAESGQVVAKDALAVTVNIVRTKGLEETFVVHYKTEDASALAGQDYIYKEENLVFLPRETRKTISIPLIEDVDFSEPTETFRIRLVNVIGQPTHDISIRKREADLAALSKADALVHQLSGIAMDIAGYYAKDKVLSDLYQKLTSPKLINQVEELGRTNHDNIIRAREKYYGVMKDLELLDYMSVIQAMDTLIASLSRQDQQQQKKVTQLTKSHYMQVAKTHTYEMDVWVKELAAVITPAKSIKPHSEDSGSSDSLL